MKKLATLLLIIAVLLCSVTVAVASDRYDLDDYGYRTVKTKGRGSLVFQKSPRGSFMKDYRYGDGDRIYVNLEWREEGYAIAYDEDDEVYGYVDARYIDWNSGDDDEYDLDNFEYRTVKTKGRGSLVFQRSPRGSFMNAYRYDDGDRILVNVDWRKDGYAIAYDVEDEVYGYVDASYIKW